MAYCLFRLFTEKQPDERRFERLRSDVIPKLRNIPGFQRFSAFRSDDGRYGGFQAYDSRAAVDQAANLLNEWRQSIGNHDPVSLELRGETGLSIVVNQNYEKGYGVVRMYRTNAPFDQVCEAIGQEGGEAIRNLPGLLRYTTVRFEDGRIATFTACENEQAARAMTEKARELRGRAGSLLSKALPTDPEVIRGEILISITKEPVAAMTA